MRLLLVRHAIAEERDVAAGGGARADRQRRLTEEGKRKFRKAAEALAELLPDLALVATSPYLRCRETADLLAAAYGKPPVVSELADLAPDGDNAGVVRFAAAQKSLPVLACVGHEPNLSTLAAWLLTGRDKSFVEMRKGGACLLDFPARIAAGGAILQWHLAPSMLRDLR
jgi:phosphohistidine phosphatase